MAGQEDNASVLTEKNRSLLYNVTRREVGYNVNAKKIWDGI